MQPARACVARLGVARFLDARRGAGMQWYVPPGPRLALCLSLAVCSGGWGACAFPVFELEEHATTPRHLTYVNAPAQHTESASLAVPKLREARASVISP